MMVSFSFSDRPRRRLRAHPELELTWIRGLLSEHFWYPYGVWNVHIPQGPRRRQLRSLLASYISLHQLYEVCSI